MAKKKRQDTGLTAEQVIASRQRYGSNIITPPEHEPLWRQFVKKFNDPLIKILLVALMLSVGLSLYEYFGLGMGLAIFFEPLGVFLAIVLATLVGFLVEVNANKKFRLLNQTDDSVKVKVLRSGHITQVPRHDIVVGDIVILDTGEKVPADGTVIESFTLTVDESSFTGEPSSWKTHETGISSQEATYPVNQLLRGSTVLEGNAVMRVERVGDQTEYGKIYRDAQIDNNIKTPLTQQLDRLGRVISYGSYVMAGLLVLGRLIEFFISTPESAVETAQYFIETVMLAVTLIVVSVPEGLPMSVTLSLALSMRKMLKHNNLVRRMHACETMGAATVICTDKTGTLTQNKMQVYQAHFYGMADSGTLGDDDIGTIVGESIACNSTAFLDDSNPDEVVALGNPTEGALLLWLRDAGVDYMSLRDNSEPLAQMPFSTMTKYMATVIDSAIGQRLLLVKGAPEIVMGLCQDALGDVPSEKVADELAVYQSKAMRTLAFAFCVLPADAKPTDVVARLKAGDVPALTFVGIVAISDPVRSDVPAAITDCRNAGVKVKIVTGDTGPTAREIGRQVGLWTDADGDDAIINGPDFAALSDDEAAQRAASIKIMARARPDDKARLVRLLQQQGEVVAVTGDGTNDAPALNAAQVGMSMGDGTAVAKEASDITILDNSFASINKAVLWGRSLYSNIQRFILFQLAVNVCACLVVAICSFFSKQPALTVTQMLWVNLIMDTFAALALASLPPNSVLMRRKPRDSHASIITQTMMRFILISGMVFAVLMIGLYYYFVREANGGPVFMRGINPNINPQEMGVFFSVFVFLQFWNMLNARSFETGKWAFNNMEDSKVFWCVAAVIFVGQIVLVQFFSPLFNCAPLDFKTWLYIILGTSPVFLIGQTIMWIKNKSISR
ncbi:MAG: calcium-translocating P-type ATPase, PMCA-type [Muribaculaceae bacterium]|nr:calcium-translocating P-type ATPase, PMCA-type [Muribaculaceae bacterium]